MSSNSRKLKRSHKIIGICLMATFSLSFFCSAYPSLASNNIFSANASEAVENAQVMSQQVSYSFDDSLKQLSISAKEALLDYTDNEAPWKKYSDCAKSVSFENGTSYIGENTLVSFSDLSIISIADSVVKINDKAFRDCSTDLTIKGSWQSEAFDFAKRNNYIFEDINANTLDISEQEVGKTNEQLDSSIVTGVKVEQIDYNKLDISWNKVDGAVGYVVYCSNVSGGSLTKVKSISSPDTTHYVHSSRVLDKT